MTLGAPPSAPTRGSPPSILVVDDNPANLLAFGAILGPLGHEIVQAASGEEALRQLLKHDVALILLDVQMPDMNGFELATLLRSHARFGHVPIIFVTAISCEATHVFAGYAHGAVDYLLKPFEPEILRAKVNVFLELHRRQQTIREQAARLHDHELKEIERRNEERFRGLTESMPLPVWGLERAGHLYVCNRAWTEYSGLTAEETGTLANSRVMHPEDIERISAEWEHGMRGGRPFDFECRLRRVDGALRWHLLRAVPERGHHLLEDHWIVAGVDVETQKTVERERARMLEREQRAREAAEAANRLRDDFLATVSHELRTPLNAILGWASIIRTGAVDPKRLSHAIATIERNARAQARLVNDILDVSRVVTGKLRLQVGPLDLVSVVTDAVETVRPAADAKSIHLRWAPPSHPVRMKGDAARLQQVVWNLLSNGIKFTPKGGRVEVAVDGDGDQVRVRVEDNGAGIAPDFLPYVFDRFRQADATMTRAHEGLGLGLSIVKSLTELHGGQVDVKSAGPGHGSVFSVTVPVGRSAENPAASEVDDFRRSVHGSRRAPELPHLDGASIIFVDDRPEARDIVEELLTRCGAKVTCSETAEEALKAIARSPPDVLISDIGLPEEDGYALIRRVRALGGPAHNVPAIALTAYARPEDEHRAKHAGFNVYLSKPIEPDELVSLVSSLLAGGADRTGDPPKGSDPPEGTPSRESLNLAVRDDPDSSHRGTRAARQAT